MTTYDDHADLLGEQCEGCGELNVDCTCDPPTCPICDRGLFVKTCSHCGYDLEVTP